jgi:tetratricopeptide (TPR) repeat protein
MKPEVIWDNLKIHKKLPAELVIEAARTRMRWARDAVPISRQKMVETNRFKRIFREKTGKSDKNLFDVDDIKQFEGGRALPETPLKKIDKLIEGVQVIAAFLNIEEWKFFDEALSEKDFKGHVEEQWKLRNKQESSITITLKEYEDRLEAERNCALKEVEKLYGKDKEIYILKIAALENKLFNIESSYLEHVKYLENRLKSLEDFKSNLSHELFTSAEEALKNGDDSKADIFFKQIIENEKTGIERAAKAFFERGRIAYQNMDYKKAYHFLEKAVSLNMEDPLYAQTLGDILYTLGECDRSFEYHKKALKLSLEKYGLKSPEVANIFNVLGMDYHDRGDSKKALKYYNKTLQIRLEKFGPNHLVVADIYHNIGSFYSDGGFYIKALEYFGKVIKIKTRELDANHLSFAVTYNNIGELYRKQGNYNKAEEYHNKALQIRYENLKPDHPAVASSYNNLSLVYKSQGLYYKSSKYLDAAISIYIQKLGLNHPFVERLIISNELAGRYYSDIASSEITDESIVFLEQELRNRSGMITPDWLAIDYNGLGNLYLLKSQYNIASKNFEKALGLSELPCVDNGHAAESYNGLGVIYYQQGNYNKAIEFYNKCLEIRIKKYGPKHHFVLNDYFNLGMAYKKEREYSQAIDYFNKSFKIILSELGPFHPDTIEIKKIINSTKQESKNQKD